MNAISVMNEFPNGVEIVESNQGDKWFGLVSGFDIGFGLLGRPQVKDKLCSNQEQSINVYVEVILSSKPVWLKGTCLYKGQ